MRACKTKRHPHNYTDRHISSRPRHRGVLSFLMALGRHLNISRGESRAELLGPRDSHYARLLAIIIH